MLKQLKSLKLKILKKTETYRQLQLVKGSNEYLRLEIRELKNKIVHIKESLELANKSCNELIERRDEFLNRLNAGVPQANNFPDYKYWLSEPFIVEKYEIYKEEDKHVDGMSAIKGLGQIFKDLDDKDSKTESSQ